MKKILYINACVRRESRTNLLARYVLCKMKGQVNEVRLEEKCLHPLDRAGLDERNLLMEKRAFQDPCFQNANQFVDAETIVIAAPYWDLSFPAILKVYLEQINVTGVAFEYTEDGRVQSLCKAKTLIYVTTAGGPILEPNLGYESVKQLAEVFWGISDFQYYKAEGLDIIGADVKKILLEAEAKIDMKL